MRRTVILSFLLCVSCAPVGIAQSTPSTRPHVTLPSSQKHGPSSQPAPFPGTIEGFVYWDMSSISHTPSSSCSGLAVTVAVGNSAGGKSTAYQSLATLSNNFKYVGQVKQFVVGGKIKTYDVCTYGYAHVPVGPDLRVTVIADTASLSQPAPFSPMSVPQKDPVGPITIINGQCNMLPRIVNPTASDLFSQWGSCQNMAYDVNFMMQPATQAMSARPIGASSGMRAQTGMPNNTPQQGMLAGGPQQGMLAPGTTQSATTQGNQGTLLGNSQPIAGQSGGLQSPGSKVELNSQLPPRQGSNVTALQSTSSGPAGNVDGYVLWDTSVVQYTLSTPCQGLQVIVVDMGNNSQPTLATSNNLTPVWSAPQLNSATSNQNYSGPTSKGPWMVCHYSFGQLPEREALEVRANVTQSSAFSPQVVPAKVTGSTGTQFTIPPGNCNTRRPRPALSTILGAFTEFCGEHAFNVNIELFPSGMGSRGPLPPNSVVQNVVSAGVGGAMLNSSRTQGGMFSGAQQPQSPGLPVVQSAQVAPSIGQLHSSLCSIANCTLGLPVIKSLNTASVVSPGGKVVIQGANFNSADGDPGQIVLKIGTKFPMPIVKLGVPTQPVFHQPYVERQLTVLGWADSHVFGQIPADITGVMDGLVTLEVWRSDGSKSAPFTVNFTAARDLQILPMSDVTLKSCTNTADGNRCDQSTDSSQLTIPSHMGFDPSFSIFGEHTTFIQNTQQQATGSDTYSFDLKNGWVLDESYQFENGIAENQACKGDFADEKFDNSKPPSKIRTSDVRIPWYVSCDLQYAVALHITGPKGVPWK
jgi:hypothetical protein